MAVAMAAFTINDSITKAVSSEINFGEVMLVRGLFAILLIAAFAFHQRAIRPLRTIVMMPVALRVIGEIGGTITFMAAITHLPLANTSAIFQAIGFLACGAQAQSHLDVFSAALPLTDVVTFSRRLESAEALATRARDKGLRARAVSDARAAIAGCDIIISSIPHGSDGAGQLDANWVEPGTFVASVDLGFGWQRASLAAFDRTVTDDREMSTVGPKGTLNYDGPIAAELSDLVTGRVAGRESADERNALIFSGTGIADLASAIAVYEVAIARGIGTRLPL